MQEESSREAEEDSGEGSKGEASQKNQKRERSRAPRNQKEEWRRLSLETGGGSPVLVGWS